jgi:hypothetical protein
MHAQTVECGSFSISEVKFESISHFVMQTVPPMRETRTCCIRLCVAKLLESFKDAEAIPKIDFNTRENRIAFLRCIDELFWHSGIDIDRLSDWLQKFPEAKEVPKIEKVVSNCLQSPARALGAFYTPLSSRIGFFAARKPRG